MNNLQSAEYILILNNDTLVEKNVFDSLINAFTISPQTGVTTCKIVYQHNNNIVWYGGGEIDYKMGRPKVADFNKAASAEGADKSRFVTFASGCLMMFKKEVLRKTGGFDEHFFMYVEDLELSFRLKESGYKIYYLANTQILHKVHASSSQFDSHLAMMNPKKKNLDFYVYHLTKNLLLTMYKHLHGAKWLKFISRYSVFILYKNLMFLYYKRFSANKAFISAIKDFYKEK